MAKKNQHVIPEGRRYVGTRETIGFIMFDMSARIPVRTNAEWTDWILNLDKGVQAMTVPITTAWDIINDLFVAAWVDKTRTRFGKFRPYLVFYPLYGLPMVLLTYALPYIFWQTSSTFLPKVVASVVMGMFNELTGTIADICRTGVVANITPDPQERLALITKANFFGVGQKLPGQIFTILRDIISRNKSVPQMVINRQMRRLFTVFGIVTITISGALSLYCVLVNRERVFGSDAIREKPPTIREQLHALRGNRPLLMLMLAEVLDGFNINGQMGTYTDSILNFGNFGLVSGIPGSPVSYASYAYITKLRAKFSTKALWIAGDYIDKPIILLIYFFGMIKVKNPAKRAQGVTYMFMDLIPMLIAFSVQNTVLMSLYGCKRVIPAELRNECIDYGEWRSGFRSEGMTGVLRNIPKKISGVFGNSLTSGILKYMGFQTGLNYTQQDERAAKGVFAMATIVPVLTGCIVLIPKLFFNISQRDREIMYAELAERRAAAAAAYAEREASA